MANSNPAESADNTLKRRARRRLIGAIALVLAAVIALPMIFDDEKRPLDQDVSIQIPGQDAVPVKPATAPPAAGVKPKTVEPREPGAGDKPKAESTPSTPPAVAPVGRDGEAKAPAKSETRTETKTEAKAAAKVEAAPSRAAQAPARAEAAKPPADATAHDATAKASRDAPPKGEEARVRAILDARPAAPAGGGFAVQIGAFAGEDKVREARDRLAGAGFTTYTEKLETREGERTRVRAGPFASRDTAESARDRIRALGFTSAAVVAK